MPPCIYIELPQNILYNKNIISSLLRSIYADVLADHEVFHDSVQSKREGCKLSEMVCAKCGKHLGQTDIAVGGLIGLLCWCGG